MPTMSVRKMGLKLGQYFDEEKGMVWERFKKIKYTGLFVELDKDNSGFWFE